MLEIKGKVNTAICYAKVIEDEAIEQIRRMCNYPMTEGSRIRIMPDVHAGKGCTIGTTMTIIDKAVPNVVGVDIGCGMYTVRLAEREIDLERLDEAAHFIPSGMNVWDGRQERFDLTELRCYRALKDAKRLERSLGTLGGGNHFIEVDQAADGTKYLVIHSGSRNLGKQVAEYYQRLAVDLNKGKEAYFARRDALIAEYKAAGRRTEIQQALKELHWSSHEATIPEDLCFVYGQYLEDYLFDVEICQRFARRNREKMAEILLSRSGLTAVDAFQDMINKGYFDPAGIALGNDEVKANFIAGKYAFYQNGSWNNADIGSKAEFAVQAGTFPTLNAELSPYQMIGGPNNTLAVTESCEHKEEAIEAAFYLARFFSDADYKAYYEKQNVSDTVK